MNWELKLTATSGDEIGSLLRMLTGAIIGNGGWVLSRMLSDEGGEIDFEFERRTCVDMYTLLIAAGLELSHASHLQFTELCHCTRNAGANTRFDVARVDLHIQPDMIAAALSELTGP